MIGIKTYGIFLFLFLLSCASQQEETTFWKYSKPEEEKKPSTKPSMAFGDIEKTMDIKPTKDSTVIGTWKTHMRTTSLISRNNEFFFYDYRYNSIEDTVLSVSKSECLLILTNRKEKSTLNKICYGDTSAFYYAISDKDSSLMLFFVRNDSLNIIYKKISHPLQPMREKQAKYQLYKERDTLIVGWYQGEDGFINKRLIKAKDGTLYMMDFSGYGYEVNKCFTSPHPKGTRLDYKPWNILSKILWPFLEPYDVLSIDSSKLYSYVILDGEEQVTVFERVERKKYDNWIDEHLFGQEGNGEPWR
ncbi:MAG: hypothetical protein WD048_01430 [Chitinophagales bacterium]